MVIKNGVRLMKKESRQNEEQGTGRKMLRLLLSLSLILLLAGCAGRSNCPEFPMPPLSVQEKFDALAEEDREVWEWGNKLLDLCQQLGTCKEDE